MKKTTVPVLWSVGGGADMRHLYGKSSSFVFVVKENKNYRAKYSKSIFTYIIITDQNLNHKV